MGTDICSGGVPVIVPVKSGCWQEMLDTIATFMPGNLGFALALEVPAHL